MSLQLESAQERLISYSAASDNCKRLGMVLYNNRCMHRNTPCCNGKGYLAQRKEDIGWGQCLTFRTQVPCTSAPRQTNQGTASCPSDCNHAKAYSDQARCGKCTRLELDYRLFVQRQSGAPAPPGPAPSAPTGVGGTDADCDNFPLGKGLCVFGKQITKGITGIGVSAGNWAQNPVAQFMPIMMLGGGVVLLAILLKGR